MRLVSGCAGSTAFRLAKFWPRLVQQYNPESNADIAIQIKFYAGQDKICSQLNKFTKYYISLA
jgi:hypothetical protein